MDVFLVVEPRVTDVDSTSMVGRTLSKVKANSVAAALPFPAASV